MLLFLFSFTFQFRWRFRLVYSISSLKKQVLLLPGDKFPMLISTDNELNKSR